MKPQIAVSIEGDKVRIAVAHASTGLVDGKSISALLTVKEASDFLGTLRRAIIAAESVGARR